MSDGTGVAGLSPLRHLPSDCYPLHPGSDIDPQAPRDRRSSPPHERLASQHDGAALADGGESRVCPETPLRRSEGTAPPPALAVLLNRSHRTWAGPRPLLSEKLPDLPGVASPAAAERGKGVGLCLFKLSIKLSITLQHSLKL